jgi:hypothetical protein
VLAAAVVVASAASVMIASPVRAATVGTTKARTEIASLVRSTYSGMPFGNVACPTSVRRAAGVTFSCTVQLPGTFLVIDAAQRDGTGAVELSTQQAVLTKQALESLVAANASIPATADCGPTAWLVRNPGDVVSCAAALSDGTTRTVQLTVRDTAGNVTIIGTT